ncbi:exodeoxyribonuclease III [Snodgrassella sp. CS2]|uniref:exodeoxyribonuclease III n=1 Tax=Snodgrassella sp. CS2 TaxID=3418953 RepID=UPI003D081736
MRIISANVNGIRSATSKGFIDYLALAQADIVCVQELKAQEADMTEEMKHPLGMHGAWHTALKRGYSGVAIYSKQQPDAIQIGLGWEDFDQEGRYVRADFGQLTVISLYMPSGSSSEERQQAKFCFMDKFLPILRDLQTSQRDILICGDWNIAHQNIDIKNWRGNLKNSGFLPEERQWLSQVINELGWVDIWRTLYPEIPGYTWWSNRGQAYAKDVGWRIDYHLTTPNLAACAQQASIYKDVKFSDHAPLIVDYAYP